MTTTLKVGDRVRLVNGNNWHYSNSDYYLDAVGTVRSANDRVASVDFDDPALDGLGSWSLCNLVPIDPLAEASAEVHRLNAELDQVREELSTSVGDPDTLAIILENLGLEVIRRAVLALALVAAPAQAGGLGDAPREPAGGGPRHAGTPDAWRAAKERISPSRDRVRWDDWP